MRAIHIFDRVSDRAILVSNEDDIAENEARRHCVISRVRVKPWVSPERLARDAGT